MSFSCLSTLLALCLAALLAAISRLLASSLAWRALAAFFSLSAFAFGSGCGGAADHFRGVVTELGEGDGGGVVVDEDVVRFRPEPCLQWKQKEKEKKFRTLKHFLCFLKLKKLHLTQKTEIMRMVKVQTLLV